MVTFSNPRHEAIIPNWPLGGNKRGSCTFRVEHHPTRGYRVGRTTTGKTKYHTYSSRVVIVDGSDGRTYILAGTIYGFIKVSRGDFMDATQEIGGPASVFEGDPRYNDLKALLNSVAAAAV
jgi:hypothetical protein